MNKDIFISRAHARMKERGLINADIARMIDAPPQTISRVLSGDFKRKPGMLPDIARALGCSLEWLIGEAEESLSGASKDEPVAKLGLLIGAQEEQMRFGEADVPVYGAAQAGDGSLIIAMDEPVEFLRRPQPLMGVRGAFSVYADGDSMEPIFHAGDYLLFHPGKPPHHGDDVLVTLKDGVHPEVAGIIKRFIKRLPDKLILHQFNPDQELTFDLKIVDKIYVCVAVFRGRR